MTFINEQRDVILFALGSTGVSLSLSGMQEIQLIVTMLQCLLPTISDETMVCGSKQ